jgi:hypothetical protein
MTQHLQFRQIAPCPDQRPADGAACEREAGHEAPHWITVWTQDRNEEGEAEWWPAYPETW